MSARAGPGRERYACARAPPGAPRGRGPQGCGIPGTPPTAFAERDPYQGLAAGLTAPASPQASPPTAASRPPRPGRSEGTRSPRTAAWCRSCRRPRSRTCWSGFCQSVRLYPIIKPLVQIGAGRPAGAAVAPKVNPATCIGKAPFNISSKLPRNLSINAHTIPLSGG